MCLVTGPEYVWHLIISYKIDWVERMSLLIHKKNNSAGIKDEAIFYI